MKQLETVTLMNLLQLYDTAILELEALRAEVVAALAERRAA